MPCKSGACGAATAGAQATGEEVMLESYARLQNDTRCQQAVREDIIAGLTSLNYNRAVESVLC